MNRKQTILIGIGLLGSIGAGRATAQEFELTWFTIDGGGAVSRGGAYEVAATIGQADAGGLSGGAFELRGGFWPGVESPGPPPCTGSERIAKARCRDRDGVNELKVIVADGTPGDAFVATLASGKTKEGVINNRGKGKAKFKDQPSGEGTVSVVWGCGATDARDYSCP